MSKRQLLCLLGVLIAVFLFLGFTSYWQRIIAVVLGLLVAVISYTLPGPVTSIESKETFTENKQ